MGTWEAILPVSLEHYNIVRITAEEVGCELRNSPPLLRTSHCLKHSTEGNLLCHIAQRIKKWVCKLRYCPSPYTHKPTRKIVRIIAEEVGCNSRDSPRHLAPSKVAVHAAPPDTSHNSWESLGVRNLPHSETYLLKLRSLMLSLFFPFHPSQAHTNKWLLKTRS